MPRTSRRNTWLWLVAALTVAALAATFLIGRVPPLPSFEEFGPPKTEWGWSERVSLLAGDGVRGSDDGLATQARFADPWGVARADDGTVYVADAGDNNRIRRIRPDGNVDTLAGGGEGFADGSGAQAAFHTPSGLALDLAGNLYVADTGNHAIRKVTPAGVVTTLAGNGQPGFHDGAGAQAQFDGPMGVAVDASGRVHVADTYNDRIRVIEPDGRVWTLAGDGRPGHLDGPGMLARFDTPTDLAVSALGRVWVADTGNRAIRHVAPGGAVDTLLEDAPATPVGLARAHDGVLHVTTLWPSAVVQIDGRGRWHEITQRGEQRLSRPAGIDVDLEGGLHFSDAGAYRVHRLARGGNAAIEALPLPVATAVAGEGSAAPTVGPSPFNPLPDTGGRWPLRPQTGWHEVVGTLGEVRGNYSGESRNHLHGGFDIRGDVGQPVVAIADAKVGSPFAAWGMERLNEGLAVDTLQYIHMRVGRTPRGALIDPARFQLVDDDEGKPRRVRIRRGTRFAVGDELGTINRMAHVHLAVGTTGYETNAVTLGFVNYADTYPPRIDSVELLDAYDRSLPKQAGRVQVPADARDLRIVVEAWDQVDRNLPRRRLGLYALGYQWLDAGERPLPGHETPRMNIEFNRMPPNEAVKIAYAPGSGITVHGSTVTRFRYELTNTVRDGIATTGYWQPSELAPGDYVLRITARDWSGNEAIANRDLRVTITAPELEPGPASSTSG
ncbi:NHL repeat-containing protein [Marilutibacter alkalisoli]|uniref:Gluconolaconase n=1 Tax=Marilutibacter alkalisoli TaxID=2591633 RepID=A0A514BTR1_9GAMM|nr:NHL repeat-containing protein [Lysobacter alkalisoli]QDH70770.1 gluconolaconase [Lysobacter alkalisoli]